MSLTWFRSNQKDNRVRPVLSRKLTHTKNSTMSLLKSEALPMITQYKHTLYTQIEPQKDQRNSVSVEKKSERFYCDARSKYTRKKKKANAGEMSHKSFRTINTHEHHKHCATHFKLRIFFRRLFLILRLSCFFSLLLFSLYSICLRSVEGKTYRENRV